MMQIIDLTPNHKTAIQQTAHLLLDSFQEHTNAWPTMEYTLREVHESFALDRISRVALDDEGDVIGWIGGQPLYDGNVWELHPLAVRTEWRGQGVGRALVNDLELIVKARGGITLWLGTDDETGQTSLGNVDLYPNVWEHITTIQNLRRHPFEFYQKLGFVIVGVMPDANGLGKPDIFMAKRIT
jgi:aminoglycoside 6'-N-acetyltransferase I